jgi:hypothetical protein
VAQIDHVIQATPEKIIGHGAALKNYQEIASIEYQSGRFDHSDSP